MNDRARAAARSVALALTIALLGACANKGTVVLLPESDGKPTAVTVRQADKEVVLDRPYAAAKVAAQGLDAYQSNPQEVEAQFGRALAAQPIRAETFVLYFVEGKDEFTDESKRLVDKVLAEVAVSPVCRTCSSSDTRTPSAPTSSTTRSDCAAPRRFARH